MYGFIVSLMRIFLGYSTVMHAQGSAFDTPEALLHGARQMAVSEIIAEPEVRRFIRNRFVPAAVITTGVHSNTAITFRISLS